MEQNNETSGQQPAAAPASQSIDLKELLSMAVDRWWWFAVSLAVTCSVAVLYLMKTSPVYTRTASVLIKDDDSNPGSIDMSELGIFQNNSNIENELLTLRSPSLMAEVVERLSLNDSYTVRSGLRRNSLYRQSPVIVEPLDSLTELPFSFHFEVSADSTVTLSDFRVGQAETDGPVTAAIGDTVSIPGGRIALLAPVWDVPADLYGRTVSYSHTTVGAAARSYAESIRTDLGSEKSSIIVISITNPSIARADDILSTLIQVYNERWMLDKNQIAVSTSQFIDDRLGVIENELGNVDSDISSYKSQHLMPDLEAASQLYMQQSDRMERTMATLADQLAIAEMVRRQLTAESAYATLPANSGIDNPNIQGAIDEYNTMVLRRDRMLSSSSERNPVVKDATNALRTMRANINESLDAYILTLRTQLQSARRQQADATGRLAANPNQARYLLSVERQQKVKEALYLFLLQKREENELSQAFTAYNTRVIDAPGGSDLPTAPRRMNVLAVAVLLGLLIPVGIIYLREMTDTRIRGRRDLEGITVPFLGEVPQTPGHAPAEGTLVVGDRRRDVVNEAFRVIRTNLDFMAGHGTTGHVVMVTSFNPGSGKSFLAANLAMSFAVKGRDVLVIDGDMRHGSTSAYAGSPRRGLSDYLAGAAGLTAADITVTSAECPRLHIIPVGSLPPNPTELLEEPRFGRLLEELRGRYDYIFIDCPPIDIVADTRIIEKHADRTVFVIRAGLLERAMLPQLQSLYADRRLPGLAVVLNGTTAGHGRNSYHYGYTYGRAYAYYNHDNK